MTPLTGDENVHYQTAQRLAADGRLAEALEEYTVALESEPTHLKAICGRGLALQSLGRHPEAIEEFDRLLVLKHDWAGAFIVHYARASSLYVERAFAESIAACNEALLIDPAHVEARYLRGIAHKALGQFDEAMSDLRETLLRDPIHFGAIDTCGKLNLLIGNYAVAVEDFTRALALLPSDSIDSIDCLRLRGIALQSIARDAEAIEDFTRVIARLPDDAGAYSRRALSYDRLGENQLARADFDRAKILVQAQ